MLAATAAVPALPLEAQTRFAWPDTAVDVARYETVEECYAAVFRVRQNETKRARYPVWKDTLPWTTEEEMAGESAALVETARRCAARYAGASAPLEDLHLLVPIFLTAQRYTDVAALVQRRVDTMLAAKRARGDSVQFRIDSALASFALDTLAHHYRVARPQALPLIDSLERTLRRTSTRPLRAPTAHALLLLNSVMMGVRMERGDTVGGRTSAAHIMALVDSLPAAQRPRLEEIVGAENLVATVYLARRVLAGRRAELDSLRLSTAAYLRLQLALWTDASGGTPEPIPFPIGRQAAPLVGMVPGGDSTVKRPVAGKVNLVVFLDELCTDVRHDLYPLTDPEFNECAPIAGMLRRMASTFPALEITLVDRTRGSFSYLAVTSPTEEAKLRRESWVAHRAPGTLVVAATDFFRLPEPDRRRIDRPNPPNVTPYTFGRTWPM
ncbi:MAG TPA: hypothetical protein VFZ21_24430, partial [Gemmatimonadaceae bacterium]|nr:hypothetical protein [Gemmatimonadaceae bacterium]